MKISLFIILFTLAAAIASESPVTVKQETGKYSTSLVQELRSFLSKAGSIWNSSPADATTEEVLTNSMNCISAEYCRKKKVICNRVCSKARRVRANHIHDKCFLKCKKCIPTC